MNASSDPLRERFTASFSEDERHQLLDGFLKDAVLEVACPACGGGALSLPLEGRVAVHECPACRSTVYVRRKANGLDVVSGDRLAGIIRHLRTRRWYCQEHEGQAVRLVGLEQSEDDPLMVTLHFICHRRSGLFRSRQHAWNRKISVLAYELESTGS